MTNVYNRTTRPDCAVRPTAMGLRKTENEKKNVGHFCGKHAMGAKNPKMFVLFFVGFLCIFCGLRK